MLVHRESPHILLDLASGFVRTFWRLGTGFDSSGSFPTSASHWYRPRGQMLETEEPPGCL
ncbi:hypothetical protein CHELA40_50375 [Chelatococcus asaccharovorans]|nr:hypothetical protein CHELA17_20340 [Chelatococcus asaccharovorans]CAH1692575.1 hypothetical protein CHELA40_50375 [Chelatococcus asaccharovorans]